MARTAVYIPPYSDDRRSDGREWLVFESAAAFLALILIISGFALYIGQGFDSHDDVPHDNSVPGVIDIGTQTTPLSLVES